MDLDIDQMCKTAMKWRFQKSVAGEMPVRDRAYGRTADKQQILDIFITEHMDKYGVRRLKNGEYVLLGCFPEEVSDYIRQTGKFPDNVSNG